MGAGPGELAMMAADGMEHPLLEARGPYDLLIANILAGPLVELAPDFARAWSPAGICCSPGCSKRRSRWCARAYRRAGFRLAARLVNGDWSILWLRKRAGAPVRARQVGSLPTNGRANGRLAPDWKKGNMLTLYFAPGFELDGPAYRAI